ncbi:MAG: hypothetical protein WBD19_08175, partial [Candidatus Acidiferrum sp.]
MAEPKAEYAKRIEKYEKRIAEKEKIHFRVGYAKLAAIAAEMLILWGVFGKHALAAYWIIAPVAAYALLAIFHGRVLRARGCANTAAEF